MSGDPVNHWWPLVHLRVPGTSHSLCGLVPGERLLVGQWADFTCRRCRTLWDTYGLGR